MSSKNSRAIKKRKIQLYNHAKRRLFERYGEEYTDEMRRVFHKTIQSNNSTPVCRQTNSKTVHLLEYCGKEYYVVYNKKVKEIVTFLSPDWIRDKDSLLYNWLKFDEVNFKGEERGA